jgi:DNA polymerase-3 subunit alpha
MDDTDKVQDLIADARANGLTVLAPDIARSVWRFEPVDQRTIRYGLGAIKGTGAAAIEHIVEVRRAAPFEGLLDLCQRVDRHLVNRRVLEALVRAGCFDSLDPNRAVLLASVGRAIEAAERAAASAGQVNLFGTAQSSGAQGFELVPARPWIERERLAHEKLALGYYFSGHLFTEFEREARRIAPTRLADLKQSRESFRICGIVISVRQQNTRRGRMCAVLLDDASAQLEVAVFSELYERRRALLKEDMLLFVTGRARYDEFAQRLTVSADDLMDLAQARSVAAAALRIEVRGGQDASGLRGVLAPYRAQDGDGQLSNDGDPRAPAAPGCRVVVAYSNGAAQVEIPLPDAWRVRAEDRLVEDLRAQATVRSAAFSYT